MKIEFSKAFQKRYKKYPQKLRSKIDERMMLFSKDKFHPMLENHPLHGEWQGYRSINITGDYRAIFEEIGSLVYFVAVDTHTELYS